MAKTIKLKTPMTGEIVEFELRAKEGLDSACCWSDMIVLCRQDVCNAECPFNEDTIPDEYQGRITYAKFIEYFRKIVVK